MTNRITIVVPTRMIKKIAAYSKTFEIVAPFIFLVFEILKIPFRADMVTNPTNVNNENIPTEMDKTEINPMMVTFFEIVNSMIMSDAGQGTIPAVTPMRYIFLE